MQFRRVLKSRVTTVIGSAVVLGMLVSGGAVAAGQIGSNDIKNGSIKKADLSKQVKKSISKRAKRTDLAATQAKLATTQGQLATAQGQIATIQGQLTALSGRVSALESKQGGVDNGTGAANFTAKAPNTVNSTTAVVNPNSSVESPNLNVPVQAGQVLTFKYVLSGGATCGAGVPRFFAEIGNTFYNTFDSNPNQCGTNGVVSYTIPVNGRILSAGFVNDVSTGVITYSNLTINGKAIPLA